MEYRNYSQRSTIALVISIVAIIIGIFNLIITILK